MASRRSRFPRATRWLFGITILLLLSSMVFSPNATPGTSQLSSRPYQPGESKVFAQDIYVSPAQAAANAQAQAKGPAGGPTQTPVQYTVSGQVRDPSNNGVPAVILVTTGIAVISTTTNANGFYSIQVDPGLHNFAAAPNDHCIGGPSVDIGVSQNVTQDFVVSRKIDQFGHNCYTETMNWIPGNTQVPFPNPSGQDQEYTTSLPADLDFRFYGGPETTLNIMQDGFITFGNRGTIDRNQFNNHSIPDLDEVNNAVYAWWNIMNLPNISNTGVYTSYNSATKTFAIEWRGVRLSDNTPVTYEIVLRGGTYNFGTGDTTGNIWINYQDVGTSNNSAGYRATIGIESNPDPNNVPPYPDGIQYSYNEQVLYNGLAIHFYLPPQGTIIGMVRDKHTPTRDPLPATVRVAGTSRRFNTLAGSGAFTMSVSAGSYDVVASANRYQTLTQTVTVQANQVITLPDFLLGSPVVDPNPAGFTDMWVVAGQTKQYTMTINNPGELDMPYILREAIDNNGGGLRKQSPPKPDAVPCLNNLKIDSARDVYDSAAVSLSPGNHRQISYRFNSGSPAPNITPTNILLYSDDVQSLYFDNTDDTTRIGSQVAVRAVCTLGYQANTTGVFNDPAAFWQAFNSGTQWDIVIIALEQRLDFAGGSGQNHWPELTNYYDGTGGRPLGKVVMSTWDVGGIQTGGVLTDALTFLNGRLGGIAREYDEGFRPVYPWVVDRDPFFTTPYTLTLANDFDVRSLYSTHSLTYMAANDIISGCKVGFNTATPGDNNCAIMATYDGRGVLASYRLSNDVTGRTVGEYPYHPVKWWANMINQVVSPPIQFGDIPWISESPTTGVVPAGTVQNPNQVVLSINATGYTTRTTRPLSGYLYLGTNDPHTQRVGIAIPLSLTIILLNDPTPTPAPPPLVDLSVWSVTAVNDANRAEKPVVNTSSAVSVTVANLGGLPGTSAFSVDVFYDLPNPPTLGTRCDSVANPGCYQTLNALGAGERRTIEFQHTFTTPGVHRVWVIVNTDLSQREPSGAQANNIGGVNVCIATRTGATFNDVAISSFAYQAVEYLACRNIVTGIGGGFFAPNATTTRAQFSVMVEKAYGFPMTTPTGGQHSFTDVLPSYFAFSFIETLAGQGVISGYDQATCAGAGASYPCFLPNRAITRAQLSILIWKAKKRVNSAWDGTPAGYGQRFTDVQPSNFAYNPIQILTYYGVVSGATAAQCTARGATYPCFFPNDNGSRAQLSVLLFKSLNRP